MGWAEEAGDGPLPVRATLVGRGARALTSSAADRHRITRVRKLEDPRLDAYRELTSMRTFVRMTAQGSAYMRFRRALDRERLELTLLLADKEPAKYERAALRWHTRFAVEVPRLGCERVRLCSLSLWRFQ
jgi:hypothetical protein